MEMGGAVQLYQKSATSHWLKMVGVTMSSPAGMARWKPSVGESCLGLIMSGSTKVASAASRVSERGGILNNI